MTHTDPERVAFLEPLPTSVNDKLRREMGAEERVLIQVATDMADHELYDERWLVITDRKLLVLRGPGVDGTISIPIEGIRTARVEPMVGGGHLEVERAVGEPIRVYFSGTLAPKFSEVAEGIKQLTADKPLALATTLEQSRCSKCGRILPEKDGKCPACTRKLDTLRRLLGYMAPYRLRVGLLIGITLLGTLAELVPPLITKRLIDDVLTPPSDATVLPWLVLGLLVIGIFVWATGIGRNWLGTWIGLRTTEEMRADLYRALQFLPLRFHDKRKVGALVSRMSNDSDLVEAYMVFDIPFIVSNALMLTGILGLLIYMNWELTIYVLLPVPPIVFGGRLVWSRLEAYWRRYSVRWSRLSSHLNESIRGIRVVKAFAQEGREGDRFDRHSDELRKVLVGAERSWVMFFMVTNFFMSFGVFFVWYFGGQQILGNELTLGELMAFVTYIWMLYQPLKWFGDFYGFMMRAYAGAERIFEVIDGRPEPFDDPRAVALPNLNGNVRFADTSFGYDPGKPILKDVDVEVSAGEMIGLVGKSGAGKTTFVNLICRFYEVTRGMIEVDGVDIRNIKLEDLRSQIGLVAQQSFLFNGTVAENIGYGKPGSSFEEILRASRAANVHEFVVKMPDGYDMQVGEQGNRLSGGEKQRIAIARAILHDPRILIFDEATSSLDTPTEKKIQEAIANLTKGRTTFAIAHRLSTLRSADRIVVLDDGRVAEVGSHEELMQRGGLFSRLVKTQQVTTAVMAVGGGHS
jgi:ATP-binding cassette subfamily B protein